MIGNNRNSIFWVYYVLSILGIDSCKLYYRVYLYKIKIILNGFILREIPRSCRKLGKFNGKFDLSSKL